MTTSFHRAYDSDDDTPMDAALTPRGGFRENAGRKSAFPGKVLDKPFAMDFTPHGRKALAALTSRSGLSRNDVIAHLTKYLPELEQRPEFQEKGVVFPGKLAADVLSIRVPKDVAAQLSATRWRTGKSYSDIGEGLVRWFGKAEKRFPILPGPDTRRPRRSRSRGRR